MGIPRFDVINKSFKRHKVRKNERLEDIAKAHRIKSWKRIWEHPENRRLKSKRRQPDAIRPGDVFVIPLSDADTGKLDKELKQWAAAYRKVEVEREAKSRLVDELQDTVAGIRDGLPEVEKLLARAKDGARRAKHAAKEARASWAKIIAQHDATIDDVKKWSTGVDTAALVVGGARAIGKLTQKGLQATKLAGEELIKINKEMTKIVVKGPAKRIFKATKKTGVYERKATDGRAAAAVKVTLDSAINITLPSFWAGTVAQIIDGKGWSEAVTYDYKKEHDKRVRKLMAARDDVARMFAEQLEYWSAKVAVFEDFKKTAESELKRLDRELASVGTELDTLTNDLHTLQAIRGEGSAKGAAAASAFEKVRL